MRWSGVRLLASTLLLLVLPACADVADDTGTTGAAGAPEASTTTRGSGTTTTAPAPGSADTAGPSTTTSPGDAYVEQRLSMVDTQIEARGIADPLVLAAMRNVPRHRFVPDDVLAMAYDDHALPIGFGQTISQPYIVALMSEALRVEPGDRVLEIGTGSGYQAAVLAEMGMEVFTIEIIPELAEQAAHRLGDLGYDGVATRNADGYFGWEEHAPFDAVMVTAAPDHVPQPLVAQLAPGARMVIPVGPIGAVQTLWVFTADPSGELLAENLGRVVFVPFTRD
jgi:protein-L-isoaspartate(D-aspartate) O-methyltransferase